MTLGEILIELNYLAKNKNLPLETEVCISDFVQDYEIQCVTTQSQEALKEGVFLIFNK
nr:MAG TPA: hypothetical protein [Caudoviricetes sp.]